MNNFAKAFEETYFDRILAGITVEAHEFSPAFEKKMKKLLKASHASVKITSVRSAKQVIKYALIAALLAILAISVAAVMYWNHLRMEQHDIFSLLYIDDISEAPETIKSVFSITADMTDFKQIVEENEMFIRRTKYTNNETGASILFSQMTIMFVQGIRLNTEDVVEDTITTMQINSYDAIYFETTSGIKNIIWDNSEYVFTIEAHGVGKDELIEIANSVQNVEKQKYLS